MPARDGTFTETSGEGVHPIEGLASIVGLLLDFVTLPNPSTLADLTTDYRVMQGVVIMSVGELGERYQFDSLPKAMVLSLLPLLRSIPGDIFLFASRYDLGQLAINAVAMFEHDPIWSTMVIDTISYKISRICRLDTIMP